MVTDVRILDLVTKLLLKGYGDLTVLNKIKRAAIQGEVISINERRYVESLAEKFLQYTETTNNIISEEKPKPDIPLKKSVIIKKDLQVNPTLDHSSHKRKIPIKIIMVIIPIVIIAIVGSMYINTDMLVTTNKQPITKSTTDFIIETDADKYSVGDIISIFGQTEDAVKISILDSTYGVVWFDEILPDTKGSYSILVIADGEGWSEGTYTIMASSGIKSSNTKIIIE